MMINTISFMIVNFYIINTLEYYIHKLSHNYKYGGFLYRYHHKHHFIDYPPNRLVVDKFDNLLSENYLVYMLIFISGCFFIYLILPFHYCKIFITETTIYFVIIDYMHNSYHLRNPYLEKYEWFLKLKKKHHIHHMKTNKNLNLVFLINKILLPFLKTLTTKNLSMFFLLLVAI